MLDTVADQSVVDAAVVATLKLSVSARWAPYLVGMVGTLGLTVTAPLKWNASRRPRIASELSRLAGWGQSARSVVGIQNKARSRGTRTPSLSFFPVNQT